MNPHRAQLASSVLFALLALASAASAQVSNQIDSDVTLDWQLQRTGTAAAINTHLASTAVGGCLVEARKTGPICIVEKHDGHLGQVLWTTSYFGSLTDFTPSLMESSADDTSIFMAGPSSLDKPSLVKLDANSGAVLWSVLLPASPPYSTSIKDIDVSADGTQVAIIATGAGAMNQQVYTMAVNGLTGVAAWVDVLDDPAQSIEDARVVVLDAVAGRIHAASMARDLAFTSRSLIRTFDLTTGAQIWSELYPVLGALEAEPKALEVDPQSGQLFALLSGTHNELRALASATGAWLWTSTTKPDRTHIALQPGGVEIAVAGRQAGSFGAKAFNRTTGASIWSYKIDTHLPTEIAETVGLAYQPDGKRVVLGLNGDYQGPLSGNPLKYLLGLGVKAGTGSLAWFSVAEPPPGVDVTVKDFALVDAAFGPQAALSMQFSSPGDVDLKLLGLETAYGGKVWDSITGSDTSDIADSYDAVALAPDGTRIYSLGLGVDPSTGLSHLLVTANDPVSGNELWSTPVLGLQTEGAELIVDPQGTTLYFGGGGELFSAGAIDAATGALLWSRTWLGPGGQAPSSYSLALAPDGSRLFASGDSTFKDPLTAAIGWHAVAYGLDAATGVELWVDSYVDPGQDWALGNGVMVSADSSRVYTTGQTEVASGDLDLFVRAFDAANGSAIWTRLFDLGTSLGGSPTTDHGYAISGNAAGTRIFVSGTASPASSYSVVEPISLALDAASGSTVWISPATASDLTGLKVDAPIQALSPDGSRLFVAAFADQPLQMTRVNRVQAISTSSGATLWTSETPLPIGDQGSAADIAVSPNGQRVDSVVNLTNTVAPLTTISNQRTLSQSAATGVELWRADRLGDTNALPTRGALAASDDYVVVAGATDLLSSNDDGFLTRFSPKSLLAGPPELSLSAGGVHQLDLDATASAAGETYWILGSLAGTTPGLSVQGQLLPLNVDAYFASMLTSPNDAVHVGSLGPLNATGRASTTFVFPAGVSPALAGVTVNYAFLAFDLSGTITFISNASTMNLVP